MRFRFVKNTVSEFINSDKLTYYYGSQKCSLLIYVNTARFMGWLKL